MARPLRIDYEKHYPTKKDGDVIILKDLGQPPGGGNRNVLIRFLDTGNEQVAQLANVKNANVRDQAKHDIIGKIYQTNQCGPIKIIKKLGVMGGTNTMYEVEFLDDGYRTISELTNIERGRVKNPYTPLVYGVGYCGPIESPSSYFLYNKWTSMLNRGYGDRYQSTSYDNVIVCDRWHFFGNFIMDCMGLPGYHNLLKIPNLSLDKDIFQICIPSGTVKVYGPNTCCFVPMETNLACVGDKHRFVADYHGIYVIDGIYYIRPYWYEQVWNFGAFSSIDAAVTIYNNRCAIHGMPQEFYINTHIRCSNPGQYRVSPNLVTDWNEDIHAPFRNLRITNR